MTEKTPDNSSKERRANVTNIGTATVQESGEHHMERLATTFESSARRWEMIVYPSLFAFIVLASYGFYLIYSLTHDVASLARNVSVLTTSIDKMVINMDTISGNMVSISGDLSRINSSMDTMNASTRSMAISVEGMRHQVGAMNYNIGRPMSQMNSFMPW